MKRVFFFFLTFLSILLLDQVTKTWVMSELPLLGTSSFEFPYGGIPLFRSFFGIEGSIVYATNTGAAWSMLEAYPAFLLTMRLILLTALLFFFFIKKDLKTRLPLLLILAGASSNVLDTLRSGSVVDLFFFIFFGYPFPVFNIADSAITIGVILLALLPKSSPATARSI